ncbi:hypothetical protein [Mucilaginibacter sp.]|uniref:hypothetical protein n=1 Tax=Mucilaginibacter sp. TaxID=1882438 RepID=UPI003D0D91B8
MKIKLTILAIVLTSALHAQIIVLPPFSRWDTNNAPDCHNVFIGRDSMLMAVKNPCVSEGIRANWRPLVGISQGLHFAVPQGKMVLLTITCKFKPVGDDVLSFYGSFDPQSDNSDIAFSRSLRMKDGSETIPAAEGYRTVTLMVNFVNETDNPGWAAQTALKGTMNFTLRVTNVNGNTHQGSYAVIKSAKLEVK